MEMTVQHRKFQLDSDLFDNSAENIEYTYRISIESIDDTYRIGSVNRCRALSIINAIFKHVDIWLSKQSISKLLLYLVASN